MRPWTALAFASVVLASTAARADDESDRVAADRLAAIVHDQAVLDQNTRVGAIAGLVVAGVVSTAIGVPVLVDALSRPSPHSTNDDIELGAGVTFTAAGGVFLVTWPLFVQTSAERLDARIAALAKFPPTERLTRAETALSDMSSAERANRRTSAVLSFVLAAINAGFVAVEIATGNSAIAFANGLASIFGIVSGSIAYTSAGPIERIWRTWRVGTGRPAAWTPILTPTGAGLRIAF